MTLSSTLARRTAALLLAALALAALGGCATRPHPNPTDPWEPFNRRMSEFNEGVDAIVLKPVATVYKEHVPPVLRTGVANFFGNIGDAWSFVNSALQGKVQEAADNFARVQINTTWGIFGIFDIASEFNIERHKEDFGQTLGRWGVGAGPYIVLPFLGPSTLRDTVALMAVDRKLDAVRHVEHAAPRNFLYSLRGVHQRSTLLRASSVLDEAALDKYSFVRDAYLQRRRAEIYEPDDPRRETPPPLYDAPRDDIPAAAPATTDTPAPAGQPAPEPAR